jgi:hypothetical protein
MAWAGIFRAFGAGKGYCLGLALVHLLLAIIDILRAPSLQRLYIGDSKR